MNEIIIYNNILGKEFSVTWNRYPHCEISRKDFVGPSPLYRITFILHYLIQHIFNYAFNKFLHILAVGRTPWTSKNVIPWSDLSYLEIIPVPNIDSNGYSHSIIEMTIWLPTHLVISYLTPIFSIMCLTLIKTQGV